MSTLFGPPLSAKNPSKLYVCIVARISTEHQDLHSLEDQIAKCKKFLGESYEGPIEFKIISSQGSGEILERDELYELEALIEEGMIDLVLVEDLARICRRNRALDICELGQDHDVRLIAINDHVDTAVDGWQDSAMMSTWHHERSNRDTSSRIKRSLNNRFDNGRLIERLVYGYLKDPDAKTDLDVRKDPAAEPVIRDIFRRLMDGASFSEIADWLNSQNIEPGPYCRRRVWDCSMVSRLVHTKLLKGVRIRNRRITRRNNRSGRHLSVKAEPGQLRERMCPHLAFFEAAYYDHVVRIVDERNEKYRRGKGGEIDGRKGIPRKRTRWPGQHARCGICGRILYWTRVGSKTGLLCSGAQSYKCWNSIVLPGDRCQQKICQAVLIAIEELRDFDAILGSKVQDRLQNAAEDRDTKRIELERQIADVSRRLELILTAIETKPSSATLLQRLSKHESDQAELQYELSQLSREPVTEVTLPSCFELRTMVEGCFRQIQEEDPEAGRLLNLMTPELYIVPYRAIDNGAIFARAHITLRLWTLLPRGVQDLADDAILTRNLIVDLDEEPQRIEFLDQVVSLRSQGFDQRHIGRQLGITQPAVQNALKLDALMQQSNVSDPYVPLRDVSDCRSRLRRHKHPRFRFEPLNGFPLE